MEGPQTGVALVRMHVGREVHQRDLLARGIGRDELHVEVGHWVSTFVSHANNELLPRVAGPMFGGPLVAPRRVGGGIAHRQRLDDHLLEITVGLRHDGAVMPILHERERHVVRTLPIDLYVAAGTAREIDRDLPDIERTTAPAHDSIAPRRIDEEALRPAVFAGAADGVGPRCRRAVAVPPTTRCQQVALGEFPREAAAELERVEDAVADFEEILAELLVPLGQHAEERTTFVRERGTKIGRRETNEVLETFRTDGIGREPRTDHQRTGAVHDRAEGLVLLKAGLEGQRTREALGHVGDGHLIGERAPRGHADRAGIMAGGLERVAPRVERLALVGIAVHQQHRIVCHRRS